MATSSIVDHRGRPIELDVLTEEISAPSLTGIRQVWNPSVTVGLTPARLHRILEAAAEGDAHQYLTLAEEMEERDMHYASVLGTRKLAVSGLKVVVESASDAAEDVRRADFVRELIDEPEFGEMLAEQVDALGKGYAVAELIWDRSGKEWRPRFEPRDQRWFRYDQDTGRELRLLDAEDTARGIALPPYKFIVHTPRIRSGLPIRGGLARLAAPAYMCKAWSWRDWMSFADIFGLPMRVGRYGPGASKEDIRKLISAVANLGSDAAAVMPDSVKIEFEQAAQVTGAGDFFEKLASWWDRQVSKGVLGQTMTSDDGSSQAQAKVHNEVRLDLLSADAVALQNTLNRQLVRALMDLNFGPGKLPKLRLVVPEPEDTKALVDAVVALAPFGFTVETSVMRDKLGLPDPEPGAELIQMRPATPAPAPAPASNRALNAEDRQQTPADLVAEQLQTEAADPWRATLDQVRDLVDSATSLEELREHLLNAFADLDQDKLVRVMQAGFAVADLVGRFEADAESS
jgi:phage gp29-like protein